MNVMVLNCGSSSLKYKIVRMPEECVLVAGEAERVGIKTKEDPAIHHTVLGSTVTLPLARGDHAAAFRRIMEIIAGDSANDPEIACSLFAHRYVHPGTLFTKTTRINAHTLKQLRQTLPLAPLHNPISFSLVELCAKEYPAIPQVAVFDTSFHATIPKEHSLYALPRVFSRKFGIHKIGFHGLSHEYVMHASCGFLKREVRTQRIISCHLGTGGSSICAISNGRSVNNSMGFTPLEGLVMNTRSGDVDVGMVFYLMFKENCSADDIETILNRKSGIVGVYAASSDMRDVIASSVSDPRARLAFSLYVNRVKKYIGYYSLLLEKPDVLIFTDSIGTGLSLVREEVCKNLQMFGIRIDAEKNHGYRSGMADISHSKAETRTLVIPTDEEIVIARQAYKEHSYGHNN
ncbi:MAG: hypothetical protein A2268_12385 [Candidatus Raymondbacteria bacterium RifOxyA12_full_50_37]|uniref:Acetate kinase n=1 Tax=Candidatus Raymondbacteria bacterium RIFOXYD12_FULL_49_13 TaxID=1817890 RepID=A0A1F7F8I7_UNCRA|nr:MAG: hypothetical protein A2268_12385 [Candidatus Raymondbacteria bacterium RifOxyA12_full_50_37]OGJ91357.1 MAG: hypothetical protein A2248_03880 [Candidatus Raymondbacteria bacterium RIFOXYA2_FULL_49_16]OGJ91574.1 MAG: hypothetical protein A2350_11820 [Candidatus Raymondbacteria bacterium RifOxyB12_full_50_8]OGJ97777.1 MAG: hypothetical protein A2453_13840 [Candidatus Raymondbacteria bacterium RIFOXYC2_FULL_50_21]OGK00155.1 MAG: hypothetical protein A2487_09490 [Candidatus Raymondbacteria b